VKSIALVSAVYELWLNDLRSKGANYLNKLSEPRTTLRALEHAVSDRDQACPKHCLATIDEFECTMNSGFDEFVYTVKAADSAHVSRLR